MNKPYMAKYIFKIGAKAPVFLLPLICTYRQDLRQCTAVGHVAYVVPHEVYMCTSRKPPIPLQQLPNPTVPPPPPTASCRAWIEECRSVAVAECVHGFSQVPV